MIGHMTTPQVEPYAVWPTLSTNPGKRKRHVFVTRSVNLASASAATPQYFLTDAEVPDGWTFYLMGFVGKVDGATNWATTATVSLQSNDGVKTFVTFAVAALTDNARVVPGMANITLGDPFCKWTGGVAGQGVKLLGDADGTGSTFTLTIWGFFEFEA